MEFPLGEWVWLPHPVDGFVAAEVVGAGKCDEREVRLRDGSTSSTTTASLSACGLAGCLDEPPPDLIQVRTRARPVPHLPPPRARTVPQT